MGQQCAVERRPAGAAAGWQTTNHHRLHVAASEQPGAPVVAECELPQAFNPDSVRVVEQKTGSRLPAKVEWQTPKARISWRATTTGSYFIYFDEGKKGETERLPEPAMVGAGERVTYGRPGVHGKLSVGLHAYPAPLDMDGDGKMDLVVACPDHPSNGIYLFRNIGANAQPLFDRAEWLGPGRRDLVAGDVNGDGALDLVVPGGYFSDVRRNRLSRFVPLKLPRQYYVGRDNQWAPVDWDGDGRIDLLIGVSDWRDYGWDDAFNSRGEWTHGPVHGYIYFHRNVGTNDKPVYAEPVQLQSGGRPLDLRGSPAPNPVDWFGRGRLDLLGGDFVDTVTLFENAGTRSNPALAAGRLLAINGKPLHMDLCMIQPRVVDWHGDGRWSLVIAEEDGRVALLENRAPKGLPPELSPPRYLEQIDPCLKSGALSRPVAFDWNGDGKLDIIAGNSAGYLQYFENVGTKSEPAFVDRGYLEAGGRPIRIMAGPNGSIQGPIEEKWGYTNPSVADWDLDGRPDILLNSIWGEVLWYRNVGTRTAPKLAPAEPIEVEWPGPPPKPEWNWWNPKGKQLVTQWRTTPKVVDWNRDGLPDLVMLDHEGYLALFERYRDADGRLRLKPSARIFLDAAGQPLKLSAGRAGRSGRRKIELADWDGDGDLDLIVDSEKNAGWHENVGSQQHPVFVYRGDLVGRNLAGHNPCPNVADWNGDGRLDLLIGAEDGFFYFFDRRFIDRRAKS